MRQVGVGLMAGILALVVMMVARGWREPAWADARPDGAVVTGFAARGGFPPVVNTPPAWSRVLTDFRCDDLPLTQAFQKWAAESGVNIVVNARSMDSMGIPPDQRVTLRLRNVSAVAALEGICSTASTSVPMRYEIVGNLVTVGGPDVISFRTYLQVYDVRDLVLADAAFHERVTEAASPTDRRGENGPVEARDLGTFIRRMIDPASWRDAGGTEGDISEFCGRLIVEASAENQRKIGVLLDGIRGGRPRIEEGDWRTVRPLGPRRGGK